ncbi:MAG TPA: serine protease, partial [Bacilli bacterium]|nr:serine protease [Bacilli bacterium]
MTEKNKNDEEEKDIFEEPNFEDFLEEEVESLDRGKRRRFIVKVIAIMISLVMVIQVLNIWLNLFSLDSLDLLRSSKQFSQDEMIQELKESVVTIQTGGSKGTGFTISSDGYILTNHHVINSPEPLIVTFPSGKRFVAQLI